MKNPLTYLNSLFETFAEQTLSGHDQLIMLHIFNKFNRSHWQETVRISDRELQQLCRLYDSTGKPITIDTIRNAKSRLKLKGLIDFKAGKGNASTKYWIVNPSDTPSQSPLETPSDTEPNSYIHACEDVKTLDVKTENTAHACANAQELDRFLDSWEASGGCKLNQWLVSKLDVLLKKHGLAKMTAALHLANDKTNGGYGFNREFFEEKLAEVLKGGDSGAKTSSGFKYKPVQFAEDEKLW